MKSNSRFKLVIEAILIALLVSGCGLAKCGDGICDYPAENCYICKKDCRDPNDMCCKPNSPLDGRCTDFDCDGDTNCPDVHPQNIRTGGNPKWSQANNLIVFDDFVNNSGGSLGCNLNPLSCNFEIFTMKPDGTDVQCLTCDKSTLSSAGHRGQPYWHPSGNYIVFSAENKNYERWRNERDLTVIPAASGRNNNVWIMTADGEQFWQITDIAESSGIIRPSFSPDGTMIYWNEEYSIDEHGVPSPWSVSANPLGEKWGLWRIRIADISFGTEPVISNNHIININEKYPGKVLLEGQGIQPDNEHLIFAAADISETSGCCFWGNKQIFGYCHWADIYMTDLNGNNLIRLTNTPYLHSENPELSPDGEKIIFTESKWCVGKGVDIYMMNSDGSDRIRLTHLNNPNCPDDYLGFGSAGELDWSPDGTKILFAPIVDTKITYPYVNCNIYMLDIEEFIQEYTCPRCP